MRVLVRAAAFCVAAFCIVGFWAGALPAASAASMPAADPHARGVLTLCDATGHAVGSGLVNAQPFVWKVVSPLAAHGPKAADDKATLMAFQPRPNVDPLAWSGAQLTGGSTYTNFAHPATAATAADPPLADFVGAHPLGTKGILELRLYLTGSNANGSPAPYAAADVEITGKTWRLLTTGSSSCRSSNAVSSETTLLPRSRLTARPASYGVVPLPKHAPAANLVGAKASATGASATADPTSSSSSDAAGGGRGSSGLPLGWLLGGLGLATVIGLLGAARLRRAGGAE